MNPYNPKQVATYAAMKSGLKEMPQMRYNGFIVVATYAAMKSGLKESCRRSGAARDGVATYAAMKSGLKASRMSLRPIQKSRSNLCRDEKRTESNPSYVYIAVTDL